MQSYKKFIVLFYSYSFFLWAAPIITTISLFMREQRLSPLSMAIAVATMSISKIIFEIPSGTWADKFSRKKLMLIAGFADLFGYSIWLFKGNALTFTVAFFIFGLSASAKSGTFEALVYDKLKVFKKETTYGKILATSGGFNSLGLMFSCILAAVLIKYGYTSVIYFSFFPIAISIFLLAFIQEAPKDHDIHISSYFNIMKDGFLAFKENPMLFKIVLVSTIHGSIAFACGNLAGAIIAEIGWSSEKIMIIFGVQIALEALIKFILSRSHSVRQFFVRHIFVMLIIGMVFLLASGITFGWYLAFLMWPMLAIDIIRYCVLNPHVHSMVESRIRATVISVWGLVGEIKNIGMILGFGLAATHCGYRSAIIMCACIVLAALAVYGVMFHKDFKKLSKTYRTRSSSG